MEGESFDSLFSRFEWQEIPNCPGRYLLARGEKRKELSTKSPTEFIGGECTIFQSSICRDPVHIIPFASGGGLLSYEHADRNCFTHSLNTPEGLARKMKHLEISFENVK